MHREASLVVEYEVQAVVQENEKAFKKWVESKKNDDYKKSAAKTAVAKTKAIHFDELYNNLETPDGAKKIYRLAATRHTSSLDIGQVKNVRSEGGQLLRDPLEILDMWCEYLRNISNTEFPHPLI